MGERLRRVTSVRWRISRRLLEIGATMELDRRQMVLAYERSGARTATRGDMQALGIIGLWGSAAIRLGRLIMPARVPWS